MYVGGAALIATSCSNSSDNSAALLALAGGNNSGGSQPQPQPQAPAGCVYVPAKTFDRTRINGSSVFIASRNLSLPAIFASDHEVTQGEYETYCKYGGANAPSSAYGVGTNYPAYEWTGIVKQGEGANAKYCGLADADDNWNAIEFDTNANGWRLPTEAEWEMLARGGNLAAIEGQTTYSGSNTVGDVAWYYENSGDNGTSTNGKTHQVLARP